MYTAYNYKNRQAFRRYSPEQVAKYKLKKKKQGGRNYRFGIMAEWVCIMVLFLKFYKILARRYKTDWGEIDIIAYKNNTIIAVEVKARKSLFDAKIAVTEKQMDRILKALKVFVSNNREFSRCKRRVDTMFVVPRNIPFTKWYLRLIPIHYKNFGLW